MKKTVLLLIIVPVLVISNYSARAESIVQLYDVDFSSPLHTIGEPPTTGAGPAPRKTPTRIKFGTPTVVQAVGALSDQPVKFHCTSQYDQLEFCVSGYDGFSHVFPRYIIEMAVLIESVGQEFTILLDTPQVRNIYFEPDETVRVFIPGGSGGIIGGYSLTVPTSLRIDVDLEASWWTISLNDSQVYSSSFRANELRTFRLSSDVECLAAVDNINVYGASDSPILMLQSPNGGEGLSAGSTYMVTWKTSTNISDVMIEYSADGGYSWMETEPPNTGNMETYNWFVPNIPSSQCLVRISDRNNTNILDISETTFTIYEPQTSIRQMTFDPPAQPGETAVIYSWIEQGMRLKPENFMYSIDGASNRPYNGTANISFISAGGKILFETTDSSTFRLISIDLAEYSTVVNRPKTITFVGHKADQTTIIQSFVIDGIIDGTGPLEDFETFHFREDFTDLQYVESSSAPYSIDNLFFAFISESTPEPIQLKIQGPGKVAEDSSTQYTAIVSYDDGTTADVTVSAVWSVEPGMSATIDANGLLTTEYIYTPQEITIYAQYTEADITIDAQMTVQLLPPQTYYVDTDATGNNDGSSWENAFNYLQDALAAAQSGDEIWVAQGTYIPDSNTTNPTGTGDREATFQLKNAVAVRGGYAGYGEPDPNARDIELYETILSGDLAGNDMQVDPCDLLGEPTRAENSYNVVTGILGGAMAILDGFTITGGNANDWGIQSGGGGMYCLTSATVTNCTFSGNSAVGQGGGMFSKASGPIVTNCRFIANSAGYSGGGMCDRGRAKVTNCVFRGNRASMGGGCFGEDSTATFTNCIFSGNTAGFGGGWCSVDNDGVLINCTFSGNTATSSGGGIGSSSDYSLTVTNSIIWGNKPDEIDAWPSSFNYCCIKDGWPGLGNIDIDPLFVDPCSGNYHLLPASPCIDTGDPCYVAGPNETDLDGNPRVTGGRIDMGAYESDYIQARLRLLPRTINRQSKMKRVMAWMKLPEDITKKQINENIPLLLYPGPLEPVNQYIFEQGQKGRKRTRIFIIYDKAELLSAVPDNGLVDVQVIGSLNTGQQFYGNSFVTIIGRQHPHQWRWLKNQ